MLAELCNLSVNSLHVLVLQVMMYYGVWVVKEMTGHIFLFLLSNVPFVLYIHTKAFSFFYYDLRCGKIWVN